MGSIVKRYFQARAGFGCDFGMLRSRVAGQIQVISPFPFFILLLVVTEVSLSVFFVKLDESTMNGSLLEIDFGNITAIPLIDRLFSNTSLGHRLLERLVTNSQMASTVALRITSNKLHRGHISELSIVTHFRMIYFVF
uniref:Uncharacterized protein n=1 Tax=Heterorhabditis bacteriophora TaxID=37862 RepID=A0A1I7X2A8_HETBA